MRCPGFGSEGNVREKTRELYPVAEALRQTSKLLKLSAERILRCAGLPEEHIATETRGVTAAKWFALWDVLEIEYGIETLVMELGHAMARGPFVPPMCAFSCAPTIEIGLQRLALFKPLVAPVKLNGTRREDAVIISYLSIEDDVAMTDWCARFETVYFLESCRIYTGEDIVPLAVGAGGNPEKWLALEPALKVRPRQSHAHYLALSLRDATLPLITQNDEMWASFEQGLRKMEPTASSFTSGLHTCATADEPQSKKDHFHGTDNSQNGCIHRHRQRNCEIRP